MHATPLLYYFRLSNPVDVHMCSCIKETLRVFQIQFNESLHLRVLPCIHKCFPMEDGQCARCGGKKKHLRALRVLFGLRRPTLSVAPEVKRGESWMAGKILRHWDEGIPYPLRLSWVWPGTVWKLLSTRIYEFSPKIK